jgi:outer membrane protein TolC
LIDVLGVLMQQPIKATVQLEQPILSSIVQNIVRPELALFDNQSKFIAQQNQLIKAKNLPKISVFAQGGYGRPGLNMLKNTFEPFAIGGLRLNWSLGNLYTEKKEKQLVVLNQQSIQIQKENLLLNINAQEKQQLADIDKINALITTDIEIIEVRESIKNAANAQLENGVITANDYLREVTAEDLAKQALITHKIQLIQSQITLQLIRGQF